MKVACLYSGGKDSTFAVWYSLSRGWEVFLATIVPHPGSYMFHHPNIELTTMSAKAIDLPIVQKKAGNNELEDLKEVLRKLGIEGVVSGAMASDYQKTSIEQICHELKLKTFTPLWHLNPEILLKDMISAGFEIVITGVYAEGLDESWLGRKIDENCLKDLIEANQKYGIHICGEGGEYESLVLDGPIFNKRLEITKSKIIWEGNNGYLSVRASLKDKK